MTLPYSAQKGVFLNSDNPRAYPIHILSNLNSPQIRKVIPDEFITGEKSDLKSLKKRIIEFRYQQILLYIKEVIERDKNLDSMTNSVNAQLEYSLKSLLSARRLLYKFKNTDELLWKKQRLSELLDSEKDERLVDFLKSITFDERMDLYEKLIDLSSDFSNIEKNIAEKLNISECHKFYIKRFLK